MPSTCGTSRCTSKSARTCGRRSRRARSPRWRARRCCTNLSASNITVGKADYRARPVRGAERPVPRRLPLQCGRLRRIDDGPRLGRSRGHLREQRAAGRGGTFLGGRADGRRRPRPGTSGAGTDAAVEFQRRRGRPPRARCVPSGAYRSSSRCPRARSRWCGRWRDFRSCRVTRRRDTNAVTRRTTSRSTR